MRRTIVLFLILSVCFVLQTTVFQALSLAGIAPNLLIIVVASFGIMRGRKEGLFVGFFAGLILDIFFGSFLCGYALLYMYLGYISGIFQKRFYPEDIKLPMLLIGANDFVANIVIYFVGFLSQRKVQFGYYLKAIIIPELIYTMVITILLYFVLLKINQKLEVVERRRAKKFDF